MKILTIANPRTGGYYFTKSIADNHQLSHYHQPDTDITLDDILNKDNISVKLCTIQLHQDFENSKLSLEVYIKKLHERVSRFEFDNIILLHRNTNKEYKESIVNLINQGPGKSHVEWVYDTKFINSITDDLAKYVDWYMKTMNMWMDLLSAEFNILPIYYEDLYYNTESVDLGGLYFSPDLNKKLRKNITTKTII